MANEIEYIHSATGAANLKAVLGNHIGQRWNFNSSAWESLTLANLGDYDLALTETPAGSYRYVASLPAAVPWAKVWVYDKSGNLAAADLPNFIAAGETAANVEAVNGEAVNPEPSDILFDGETLFDGGAGGSSATRILFDEAYDADNFARYVGQQLILPDFDGVPREITNYGNPGSGAAYVDVDEAYDSAPGAGESMLIKRIELGAATSETQDTTVEVTES